MSNNNKRNSTQKFWNSIAFLIFFIILGIVVFSAILMIFSIKRGLYSQQILKSNLQKQGDLVYKKETNRVSFENLTPTLIPFIISSSFDTSSPNDELNTVRIHNARLVKGYKGQAIYISADSKKSGEFLNNLLINKTISGNFSLSLWANRLNIGNVALVSNTNSYDGGFALVSGDNGEIYCRTSDGQTFKDTYTDYEGGYLAPGSGWHYITIVMKSGNCEIYVDGVNKTFYKINHNDIKLSGSPLILGGWDSHLYQGYLDEIELNNYALTPLEVKRKYDGFSPYSAPPP